MSANILITGASGFVGQHACEHFSEIGMKVKAAYLSNGVPARYESFRCDLTVQEQVQQLIEQTEPDFVLHLAGRNSAKESWEMPLVYINSNVISTILLLQTLRKYPECRILVIGSANDFPITDSPAPQSPYSLSKTLQVVAAQSWSRLFGQSLMIGRPVNMIGPGFSAGICALMAKKIAGFEAGTDRTPMKLSSLKEDRDYVDVRDAVRAFEKILLEGKPGDVYTISSGKMRTLGDIVHTFQEITGRELPLEIGSSPDLPQRSPLDSNALLALGWKPKIAFEQSLRDALQFFRNQHGEESG